MPNKVFCQAFRAKNCGLRKISQAAVFCSVFSSLLGSVLLRGSGVSDRRAELVQKNFHRRRRNHLGKLLDLPPPKKRRNTKKRTYHNKFAFLILMKNLVLCLFLSDNFLAVVKTAVFANSVGFLHLVAMRALNERRRRSLIVSKALIRSALRLFTLGNCHFISPLFLIFFVVGRSAVLAAKKPRGHVKQHRVAQKFAQVNESV